MASLWRSLVVALAVVALWAVLAHSRALFGQAVPPENRPTPPKAETVPERIPEADEAFERFKARDWPSAVELLQRAVKKNKNLPPAHVIMFQWFAQSGQGFLARMSLEQAVMSDPKDPEAIVILGNIALQERRINDAELTFLKAEHLLKDFDKSPMRKGILELQTLSGLTNVDEAHERWKDAQAKLELLLQLSPRDAMVMQRLARALFQQGNAAESLKWLRKSKEVGGPDILTPEAALAKFYEQYGDHRNAVVWMHKALDKAPEDAATQLVAARWALEAGQLDDFETHAVKGLQLATAELQRVPEERSAQVMARLLNAKILRGLAALFRKDYATAEKYFEAARLQSPGNFAATNNLALTLCEQTDEHTGQPDQAKLNRALELVNANYKIDPRNPEINSTLGWVLYRAGMLARAEDALRQAASSGNVSPDTAYYLAQVSYDHDRRNRELAKNLLEAALNTPFFSMRAEAQTLLDKIKAEPPPKAEPLPKAVEKPKNAR